MSGEYKKKGVRFRTPCLSSDTGSVRKWFLGFFKSFYIKKGFVIFHKIVYLCNAVPGVPLPDI